MSGIAHIQNYYFYMKLLKNKNSPLPIFTWIGEIREHTKGDSRPKS